MQSSSPSLLPVAAQAACLGALLLLALPAGCGDDATPPASPSETSAARGTGETRGTGGSGSTTSGSGATTSGSGASTSGSGTGGGSVTTSRSGESTSGSGGEVTGSESDPPTASIPPSSTGIIPRDWPPVATSETACNGHDALCDRPFPEVVFAATHNSMSNAAERWAAPNQNLPIELQLSDGIRAFLLDTYLWRDDLWLCHARCEFGRRPLREALEAFHAFMVANPREVITFLFEDSVEVDRKVAMLEETGLADFAWTQEAGEPWPTLEEMIDSGRRLLITAERRGPPPAWYHHLWDLAWDTPFSFSSVDEFNCNANRGSTSNALFLINHWVLSPLAHPDNAREANTRELLLARIDECLDVHGRLPTFLAVDFHDIGDLLEVVDHLNAVEETQPDD